MYSKCCMILKSVLDLTNISSSKMQVCDVRTHEICQVIACMVACHVVLSSDMKKHNFPKAASLCTQNCSVYSSFKPFYRYKSCILDIYT